MRSIEPRTLMFITKSNPRRSKGSPCRSMILAGLATPAAAMTLPTSFPVPPTHESVPFTAFAMLSVLETSVVKNLILCSQRSLARAFPRSSFMSRMDT